VQFATLTTRNFARRTELTDALEQLAALDGLRRRLWFDALRAEIIVAAAALLEAILERPGVDQLSVTKRGLRDGVLADLAPGAEPALRTA
jgi:exopolyphosphatase/pppGpp-phosphohydrolase